MRKLIFLLFLIPAIAALAHDIYIFTQNQEKGIHLSDLGALWSKYHKESHDNWKINVKDLSQKIEGLVPESIKERTSQTSQEALDEITNKPDYAQNFAQLDSKEEKGSIALPPATPSGEEYKSVAQSFIGIALRQKAVLLFGGIALFLYFANSLLAKMFKPREGMSVIQKRKKKKNNKGGYQYSRK